MVVTLVQTDAVPQSQHLLNKVWIYTSLLKDAETDSRKKKKMLQVLLFYYYYLQAGLLIWGKKSLISYQRTCRNAEQGRETRQTTKCYLMWRCESLRPANFVNKRTNVGVNYNTCKTKQSSCFSWNSSTFTAAVEPACCLYDRASFFKQPKRTAASVNGLLVMIISCWRYKEEERQSDQAERIINNTRTPRPPNTGDVMFLLQRDQ